MTKTLIHPLSARLLLVSVCTLVLQSFGSRSLRAESPSVQPCQSWRYNSTVNGYVCSYYSFSARYAEQWELNDAQDEIRRLQQRVTDLEARVSQLETPTPESPKP